MENKSSGSFTELYTKCKSAYVVETKRPEVSIDDPAFSINFLQSMGELIKSTRTHTSLIRDIYVNKWSWGYRPEKEGFKQLSKFIQVGNKSALEIGAGTGLWGELYRRYCEDYNICAPDWICTDSNPPVLTYTHVHHMDAKQALEEFPNCETLILVWPPWDSYMGYEALIKFQGKQLIYVGENEFGCTGDDKFHVLLAEKWKQIDEIPILSWPHIGDRCKLYIRM
jgi:hypothetical protein